MFEPTIKGTMQAVRRRSKSGGYSHVQFKFAVDLLEQDRIVRGATEACPASVIHNTKIYLLFLREHLQKRAATRSSHEFCSMQGRDVTARIHTNQTPTTANEYTETWTTTKIEIVGFFLHVKNANYKRSSRTTQKKEYFLATTNPVERHFELSIVKNIY